MEVALGVVARTRVSGTEPPPLAAAMKLPETASAIVRIPATATATVPVLAEIPTTETVTVPTLTEIQAIVEMIKLIAH